MNLFDNADCNWPGINGENRRHLEDAKVDVYSDDLSSNYQCTTTSYFPVDEISLGGPFFLIWNYECPEGTGMGPTTLAYWTLDERC